MTPKTKSIETILNLTRWHQYGDTSVTESVMRTKEYTFQYIWDANGTYRTCYKDCSNKIKRDHAKERYEKALTQNNCHNVEWNAHR